MALPDLVDYTDDELNELETQVLIELERRRDLANIPAQMQQLRQKFLDGGGDPVDLEPTEQ